jgi:hypothetical protein
MERVGLQVMSYSLERRKKKKVLQDISRVTMCPTELKMQPTIHFRISKKSWLLKLKYPTFFGNGKHKQEII